MRGRNRTRSPISNRERANFGPRNSIAGGLSRNGDTPPYYWKHLQRAFSEKIKFAAQRALLSKGDGDAARRRSLSGEQRGEAKGQQAGERKEEGPPFPLVGKSRGRAFTPEHRLGLRQAFPSALRFLVPGRTARACYPSDLNLGSERLCVRRMGKSP